MTAKQINKQNEICPCGSGRLYLVCCGKFHQGLAIPKTAEELMRSRYSAYVKGCIDYLIDTTHPQTRDTDSYDELRAFASSVHWLGLDVLDTRMGGEKDKVGKVEFVARYLNHGTPCEIHELSRFKKLNNRWLYLDGETVGKAEG